MKNVSDFYPLSPMQQGMLFHSLYAPESAMYVQQLSCTLHGNLAAAAFKQAWESVVNRHAVLRTAFVWDGVKEPVQVVHRQVELPWQSADWRDLPEREQSARWLSLLETERAQGFEMKRAPLMRWAVIQTSAETFQFIWSFHHALLDGWSVPLVLNEVMTIYHATRQGQAARLRQVRPYRDYIGWLRQQDLTTAAAYWRRTLDGVNPPTALGIDRAPSALKAEAKRWRTQEKRLPATATAEAQSFVRQQRLTLNTLAQATWALLLSRYSGERDVVFGVAVSGRQNGLPGIESMIGLCINTLPLRVQVEPETRLLPWLEALQARQFEMSEYESTPLARIQEWTASAPGSGLFESLLVFENYPVNLASPGWRDNLWIDALDILENPNLPLTLLIVPGPELTIRAVYDDQRFEAAAITRLLDHFVTLLERLAVSAEQRLSDLDPLPAAERQQLLVAWNATAVDYPLEQCLHQLIEAQVEGSPGALALMFENQRLSYRELNGRANQLAHHLRRMGVGPDVLVGVCMERSVEMVVGLLGILKAGGAYLPLDPSYPTERLAFMLDDAQVDVLLTQARLQGRLPQSRARAVCLDSAWAEIAVQSADNPRCEATPDNLAYAIYTSGSTGKPKGALISHRGICNRLLWMQEAYGLNEQDRVLQKTPFSFDVSVWEFFWPLMTGAALVVARPEGHKDSAYLVDLIAQQQITTLHFVPSMLQMFLQEAGLEKCQSIKRVICSGEALPYDLQERFFSRLSAELHNLYGPTEASVDVTFWACQRQSERRLVPIGRPIANTRMHILSPDLRVLPIGVPGDLYIGGVGLGRGYLNRPELTAEKFIPDPFSHTPGARLYKTGDLARYLPDGEIDYLGRTDFQVKIRGFRIELGEVEAALMRQEEINETVVVAQPQAGGDLRLVAYYIASGRGQGSRPERLREALKRELPEYLIPSAFMELTSLPRTASGKLDRRRLPQVGGVRPEIEQAYMAAATPDQALLAEVWAEALGLDRVGIRDNFFALGGDSIRSIQVRSRAAERGLKFTLAELFEQPTIEALVKLAARQPEKNGVPEIGPKELISASDRAQLGVEIEDAYPLAMLQAGMLFHSELQPESAVYHDVFSYTLRGPFDPDALQAAAQELVSRHAVLRTSFDVSHFSERLQLVHRRAEIPLAVTDLRGLDAAAQATAIDAWIGAEKQRPFDWQQPPLLRFQVHLCSPDTFTFSVSFHHIILDGWSVAAMLTELFRIFLMQMGKDAGPLAPEPRRRFRDFIALEKAALADDQCQRYWTDKLRDWALRPLPRWPATNRETGGPRLKIRTLSLSPDESENLRQLAALTGLPIKSVLLAAHVRVLCRLGAQPQVLTGLVTNGRPEETDGERTLGLFLNTLPLAVELKGGSWLELLQQCFAAEQEAMPFRRYPLAQIQKLHGGRPLFETAFNYAHFHVYQGLSEFKNFQSVSSSYYEETHFTLVTNFSQDPQTAQLQLHLNYDSTQLDSRQIELIAGYYGRALQALVTAPSGRYDAESLLSPQELRQVLDEWNATSRTYPAEQRIHELFEQQAEQQPDAVAISFEGESINYQELNQRANQLAHYLCKRGVGPDALVGICLERSGEMIAAMLAVLKAGGAYLPIDPGYPSERIAFLLEDAPIAAIITRQDQWTMATNGNAEVLYVDAHRQAIERESAANLDAEGSAANLAYVIYTSGSTGRPKGTLITHQNVVRLVKATDYASFGPDEVFLQMAPASFDASTFEIWGSLLNGSRLVVMSPGTPTLADIGEVLAREQVTTLWLTAGLFHLMVDERIEDLRPLRQLLAGGDVLSVTHVQKVLQQLPHCRLINGYGPTESTTFTCCHTLAPDEPLSGSVPLGGPIANTRVFLLDRFLQPVPVGVPGQLHIGGDGLARGYLNRADLTAERFIPDPFSAAPGARLYNTGDLACYGPDGVIEFLGRLDNQVKIRGFRIEMGEIEAVLSQHPSVRETVVIAQADEAGEKRLVGYVVPRQPTPPPASELRQFLKEMLPVYMIPSAFVNLARLPLTVNGKVDRSALPLPGKARPEDEARFRAPRTPVEELLTSLWIEILKIEPVGIEDDFFELGGDSLRAIQMISRIRDIFQVPVPLRGIYEKPTVAGLAQLLIDHEAVPGQVLLSARLQQQIDRMSDVEIRALLQKKTKDGGQPLYGN